MQLAHRFFTWFSRYLSAISPGMLPQLIPSDGVEPPLAAIQTARPPGMGFEERNRANILSYACVPELNRDDERGIGIRQATPQAV